MNNGVVCIVIWEMNVIMSYIRVKIVVIIYIFKMNIVVGLCVDIFGLMCLFNVVWSFSIL